jgi:hypothetical protein
MISTSQQLTPGLYLKGETEQIRVDHDIIEGGLFPKNTWERLLRQLRFTVYFEPIHLSEFDAGNYIGIITIKVNPLNIFLNSVHK